MEATVRVKIGDDGSLGDPRVVKGSGNVLFDSSCVEAVAATKTLPDLPPQCRTRFRRGIALQFDGATLR
jgi:TonB family protein